MPARDYLTTAPRGRLPCSHIHARQRIGGCMAWLWIARGLAALAAVYFVLRLVEFARTVRHAR